MRTNLLVLLLTVLISRCQAKKQRSSRAWSPFGWLRGTELSDSWYSINEPFTLVLTAHVAGGSESFLNLVVPNNAVVVRPKKPMSEAEYRGKDPSSKRMLKVMQGKITHGVVTGKALMHGLAQLDSWWEKVFINHPIGIPTSFLRPLLGMKGKRFISITHDFTWIIKNPQPSFTMLRTPGGGDRNYLLQPFLTKLEMKSQHKATADLFRMSGAPFRSLDVVEMPDHFSSMGPGETSCPNTLPQPCRLFSHPSIPSHATR